MFEEECFNLALERAVECAANRFVDCFVDCFVDRFVECVLDPPRPLPLPLPPHAAFVFEFSLFFENVLVVDRLLLPLVTTLD